MTKIMAYEIVGRMPPFTRENRELVRRGIKTQTRRVIKTQPETVDEEKHVIVPYTGSPEFLLRHLKCPYGAVGDIRVMPEPLEVHYHNAFYADDGLTVLVGGNKLHWRWRVKTLSSRFMPVECGRTDVRYTRIWVERLQDISEADAVAEGCSAGELNGPCMIAKWDAVAAYRDLWDSINGKTYPWDSNPWVWCIEWELLR